MRWAENLCLQNVQQAAIRTQSVRQVWQYTARQSYVGFRALGVTQTAKIISSLPLAEHYIQQTGLSQGRAVSDAGQRLTLGCGLSEDGIEGSPAGLSTASMALAGLALLPHSLCLAKNC